MIEGETSWFKYLFKKDNAQQNEEKGYAVENEFMFLYNHFNK